MNFILEEIISGSPDMKEMVALTLRLVIAMFLGAVIGAQRERRGKPAGLRTHMLGVLGRSTVYRRVLTVRNEFRRDIACHSRARHRDRLFRGWSNP